MKRNKINWTVPKGAELTELDKKVLYWQNKGHLVPRRSLIKTPEQIEGVRRSGVVNTGALDLVAQEIHAGMSTAEIDQLVHNYITSHGGIPATLGYEGYPKSVCTSINEVVCHGIPSEEEILEEGDIINVDITTILDGYMQMLHECLLSERLLLKKKSWFVWPKNAWKSEWKQPNLSVLWVISAMQSRNMRIRTAFQSYVIFAVMA